MTMFRDALRAKTLRFNSPPPECELAGVISKMKHPPSEALRKIWQNVGEGPLPNSWDVALCKPGQDVTFAEGDRLSQYDGSKRLIGSTAVWIGRLWDGTDSVTHVLEVTGGADDGNVGAFSYGDFNMYMGAKTTSDLLEFVLSVPADTEYWEISTLIFNAIFSPTAQPARKHLSEHIVK
jgi:hypothetical protein